MGKLSSMVVEHDVFVHLLAAIREEILVLGVLKWEEKPYMMMKEQGW